MIGHLRNSLFRSEGGRTRTCDRQIRNLVLYPAELRLQEDLQAIQNQGSRQAKEKDQFYRNLAPRFGQVRR